MKIGSVRFYKHLILTVAALMVIVPVCTSVYFGANYLRVKNQLNEYEKQIEATERRNEAVRDMELPTPYDLYNMEVSLGYQELYPEMYVEKAPAFENTSYEKPVVYLTFDDGPSSNTETVLNILKENDIKATFFVVNTDVEAHQYLYKRIVDEGHTLGIHTYSHQYTKIYSSVESYLEDFNKIFTKVYELTGVKPTVFRFPGGSINTYNQHIYTEIISEMLRRGFTYYDWNVSSGDAGITYTSQDIRRAVVNGVGDKEKSIVLMHDSAPKGATAGALQQIIDDLKETHVFKPITNTVKPKVFTYKDNHY